MSVQPHERQDPLGRFIRVGTRVRDAHHNVTGTVERLSKMAWIVDDAGKRRGVNYDDLTVIPE